MSALCVAGTVSSSGQSRLKPGRYLPRRAGARECAAIPQRAPTWAMQAART